MIAIAVNPMATPINALRRNGSRIVFLTGDPGYSINAVNKQAESMKHPRPVASIRNSGQCLRAAVHICMHMYNLGELTNIPWVTTCAMQVSDGPRTDRRKRFLEDLRVALRNSRCPTKHHYASVESTNAKLC